MVGRGDLTDAAWAKIAPLLPKNGRRGGQWRDHRQVVNGIIWKYRTGAPWRGVPARYGPCTTLHDRAGAMASGRDLGADAVGR